MSGPTKHFDPAKVGEQVQSYRIIFNQLFDDANQKSFRQNFFDCANETELRAALAAVNVIVDLDVRIMLVDIENARTLSFPPPINPATDKFYVGIMPPVPRRDTVDASKADYKAMQAWESAWHHAIVDGYGL